MTTALAYLNFGNWVVDCPEPGCFDARAVYAARVKDGPIERHDWDVCANGHRFEIEMPPPRLEAAIVAAVSQRPFESDRAWYPQGHRRAILAGQVVGQTVDELIAENTRVAQFRAEEKARENYALRHLLAQMGIQVDPDGKFEGKI